MSSEHATEIKTINNEEKRSATDRRPDNTKTAQERRQRTPTDCPLPLQETHA